MGVVINGKEGKVTIGWLSPDDIEPNDYNPNEMSDRVFEELSADIGEEELDQPVVVRPHPEKEGKFIIVDGEHRWKASKVKKLSKVPVSIREYSEQEAMIKTVRRNLIHGDLNPAKFNALLMRLDSKGITPEKARELMAMETRQFDKVFAGKTDTTAEKAEKLIEGADKGVQLTAFVANLSQMVRDIITNCGDTIDKGFIAFSFKGQTHLMVSMDKDLQKVVAEFVSSVKEDGLTQAQVSAKIATTMKTFLES